jgi:hypothetical protein
MASTKEFGLLQKVFKGVERPHLPLDHADARIGLAPPEQFLPFS